MGRGVGICSALLGRFSNGIGTMGLPSRIHDIPPSVVRAICAVQASLEGSLKRDGKNTHGGYAYTSTDAVYAALTLKLAEAGLSIIATEEHEPEIKRLEGKDGKPQQWGKFSFGFILATDEATWYDEKSRRSLFIQITGPQTFMAAESYAMKAFLRSLFKLPTGDIDLDSMPQERAEYESAERPSSYAAKSGSATSQKVFKSKFNRLKSAIQACANIDDLRALYTENADASGGWSGLPRQWADDLEEDFKLREQDLSMEGGFV